MSFKKKIVFSLIPIILLLLFLEASLRVVYFQIKGDNLLAVMDALEDFNNFYLREKAADLLANHNIPSNVTKYLYENIGQNLLKEFEHKYEENFILLLNATHEIKSKFILLYIPSEEWSKLERKAFFSNLTKKYNIDLIDLSDEFSDYNVNHIFLLPENGHLSRFGNQIVAKKIAESINNISYQSNYNFIVRPHIMGDLKTNKNKIWNIVPSMSYKVITNKQGFRMNYDLSFPKTKQRILILGDSFTFGPYLPNHDTYPALLNKIFPDKEIINAGIASYTISDEAQLFIEKAKYVEPDIVILQVLDNDLSDFFFFKRNQFSRDKKFHKPSKEELDLFNKLKK